MANTNNPVVNSITFVGSLAQQATIEAQGIAGGLTFLLPNIPPIVGQVMSATAVNGNNVFLGFTPPPPSSFSFSQITGLLSVEQLEDVEGNGSKVQLTTGAAPGSPVTTHLGTAANYALLAYSGITNTGSSVITGGNIGSAPTPGPQAGFTFTSPAVIDNANAGAARTAGNAAFAYFSALVPTQTGLANLSTNNGGGGVGVYHAGNYFGGALDIPTSITLDAQGDTNAVFVFVSASTTILESGASVLLVNGAQAANVVWCVGSSFTQIGNNNTMVGVILAYTSITLDGGTLNGRALAVGGGNGAVTIAAAEAITATAGSGAITAGDVVIYDAFGNVIDSGVLLSSLGGGAGVLTFNGRVGNVIPLSGDYAAFYAVLASPAFTGVPTAPTASPLNNSTQIATTAYADAAVAVEVAARTSAVSAAITTAEAFATAADTTVLSTAETFATTGDSTTLTAAEAFATAADLAFPKLYNGASGVPAAGDNHIASGTVTLAPAGSPAAGSATVTMTGSSVFSGAGNYYVYLTYQGAPVNPGTLWYAVTNGSTFTIYSTSGTDTSTVAWTAVGY